MILPEFCEELFYFSNINLFETNFKIYLQKVLDYNIFNIQKWLIKLDLYYTIQELKNLKQLNLSRHELTTIPNLSFLPNLQWLYLHNNKLTELPNLNLPNLKELCLSCNQLKTIPNFNLPKLQILTLYNNQLTSIPTLITPNLQTLYIWNNQLTNKSIEYLRSLNIKNLYLN